MRKCSKKNDNIGKAGAMMSINLTQNKTASSFMLCM